ncbi:hypothetical protein VULLAG_LOCUS21006 [Vulpes lagopus]
MVEGPQVAGEAFNKYGVPGVVGHKEQRTASPALPKLALHRGRGTNAKEKGRRAEGGPSGWVAPRGRPEGRGWNCCGSSAKEHSTATRGRCSSLKCLSNLL